MTTTIPNIANSLRRLRRLGLIVVTGKGGVGKTTVSVALGMRLAREGARVLVLEIDPRESAHRLLGLPPSDGALLEAEPGLYLRNLQPRAVVDSLVREQVRLDLLARRILRSPIYEHFVAGCPGLEELALLSHIERSLNPRRRRQTPFDLVILDAPATGHGLTLLAAPRLVSDVIEKGPFGLLAAELATLVSNTERCGVVVVTHAEELPVLETLELAQALRRDHGREPELLVANGLYPPWPASRSPTEPAEPAEPAERLWQRRRQANETSLTRLKKGYDGPLVCLPRLPVDEGPQLAGELAGCL